MRSDELVVMGYVRGAFGIRGALKIHAETGSLDGLFDYPVWWLGREGEWVPYTFVTGQVQGRAVVAQLEGLQDRDVAESMRGMQIAVPKAQLPAAEEGEYYWTDLIGCRIENLQGACLGTVSDLMETGANDVLVVDEAGQTQRLIPFVDAIVHQVNVPGRIIIVDWQADY